MEQNLRLPKRGGVWWPFNVFGCLGPLPLPDNHPVSHKGLLLPEWMVSVEVQIQIKPSTMKITSWVFPVLPQYRKQQ